jgi:hypothetical protein
MKQEQIEKLLEKWGENKERNPGKRSLPVLVLLGYKIGKQWAGNQKTDALLSRFKELYKERNFGD